MQYFFSTLKKSHFEVDLLHKVIKLLDCDAECKKTGEKRSKKGDFF